jgi:hypothetical protein
MPPEILALIDKPLSLVAVMFVGALFGMAVEQFVSKQKRAAWRRRNAPRLRSGRTGNGGGTSAPKHDALPQVPDAADQLRTVMKADFKPQPLLNKSEARLIRAMDKMVIELAPPGWQVMAQVSLGEILRCDDKEAYGCINSKRVDLLIVDAECKPLHAIEYQGGAHYKGAHATAARDAVKKEALRRAGIGYVEVVGGEMSAAELRRVVERLVQRNGAPHHRNSHR